MMQVRVLGPLAIDVDGAMVEIGGARLRALLIRLSAEAGSWVAVGRLVEALWPGAPPTDEVNALQSLVSRLRRALSGPGLVESGPAGYRLRIAPEDVDALAFEQLIGRGRQAGDAAQALELFEQALRLWRGVPLGEVADSPYAQAWAQRLEQLRLGAVDEQAAATLDLGRAGEAVAELEQQAAEHPLRERTNELLIRSLAAAGRQTEALAVYERLRRTTADELGLDPTAALRELHQQVLREDPALRGRVVGAGKLERRTNLRAPLTSFVGRQDEMDRIADRLSDSRLVTLVGTGGAGKTRLACEVAGRLGVSGGVWLVELAPVTDPEHVAGGVLDSIGTVDRSQLDTTLTQHQSARDLKTRLVDALTGQDVVIVLDNCEHLIESCAELAEFLLARCPGLRVLATSREPLGIVGESIWPVRPLPVNTGPKLDSPAVRLFADRAALVRPGFTVTADNAEVVIEICRRLDGLPLAIELAAARLRTLEPEALAARLDNRFRLLTGGNRTALPRHQALRAVVAWSWDLLSEAERDLVERLAVFFGGANPTTAAQVCSAATESPEYDEDTVADLLFSLADKSLLVVSTPALDAAQPRYRLLETIREYALERLAERAEVTLMRRAHARYFLDLAETADPHLRRTEQLVWLARLTAERDNLLASLRFAVETQDADHAVRMVAALGWYWTMTNRHEEGGAWAEQALRVPGESPSAANLYAQILCMLQKAMQARAMPDPAELTTIEAQLTGIDVRAEHPLLTFVGPALIGFRDGMAAGRRAAEEYLDHPDPWTRAMIMLAVGVLSENEGAYEVTRQVVPQAMAAFEEIGDRWGIATAGSQMSELERIRGNLDTAIALLERSRQLMALLVAAEDESNALVRIAALRRYQGDFAGARRDLEAAARLADDSGEGIEAQSAFRTAELAALEAAEGDLGQARRLAEAALERFEALGSPIDQIYAMILSRLADIELSDGDPAAAAAHLHTAVQAAVGSSDMPVVGQVVAILARYRCLVGDPLTGAELLGAAARLCGHSGLHDPKIREAVELTVAAVGRERFDDAFGRGQALDREQALALVARDAQQAAAGTGSGPTAVPA